MSKNQAVDRSVGLFVTIVGALAIAYTVTIIRQHLQHDHKADSDHPDSNQTNSDQSKTAGNTNGVSSTTPARLPKISKEHLVVHHGSCHCTRVHFKILGPQVLQTPHDLTPKLRFPRVTVLYQDFELLTHPSVLSMYTVQPPLGSSGNSPHQYYHPGTSHLFSENEQVYNNNEASPSSGIYSFCSYCGMHVIFAPGLDPVEIQVNVDCLQGVVIDHHPVPENVAVLDKRGIGCAPSPLYPLLYNRYQPASSHTTSQFVVDPVDVVSEPFSDTTEDMYLRQQQQQQQQQQQRERDNMLHYSHHKSSHRQKSSHRKSRTVAIPVSPQVEEEEDAGSMSSAENSMESQLDLKVGPSRFHFHSPNNNNNNNSNSGSRYQVSSQQQHHGLQAASAASINMSSVNATHHHADDGLDLFQQLYPYTTTNPNNNPVAVAGASSHNHLHATKDFDDWYSIPSPMPTPDRHQPPQPQHRSAHHHTPQHSHQHSRRTPSSQHSRTSPRPSPASSSSLQSTPATSPMSASIPRVSHVLRQSPEVIDADLVVQLPQFKKHLNRHLKEGASSTNSSVRSELLDPSTVN